MARQRTGSVWLNRRTGLFMVQVTFVDGTRGRPIAMPAGTTLEAARARARELSERVAAEGWLGEARGETLAAYAERWLESRRDPKEARGHLKLYVLPALGARPLREITRRDLELIVADLDRRVRVGELRGKTATNVWGTVTKLFDDACNTKLLELRVLEGLPSPADRVRGPDRGDERQSAYLYPREATALLAHAGIPARWRVAYAIALYTGLRQGELAVLRVADVALEGGYLNVHQARDRRAENAVKLTKGRRARRVPIEPSLRPLLEALTEGRPRAELLLSLPPKQKMAEKLREHLLRAGLDRDELHAADETRRQLTFHDLRHTYATWRAIAGENELAIQRRLGHATADQTQRYIAEAEALGRGDIGEPFAALPAGLVEEVQSLAANASDGWADAKTLQFKGENGGVDGTRTRGLRRDRPAL
jgi:integrase